MSEDDYYTHVPLNVVGSLKAITPERLANLLQAEAERDTLRQDLAAAQALLPGVYYMDPPDGGNVDLLEQWNRMAKDALRYRWLRRNPTYLGWEHDCPPEFIDANVDAALAGKDEK